MRRRLNGRQAQANLGMAMCFQLQSILSETISLLLVEKAMEEENQRVLAQVREEEVSQAFIPGKVILFAILTLSCGIGRGRADARHPSDPRDL